MHILDKKIIHTRQGQHNRYMVQWEGLAPTESTRVIAGELMNHDLVMWKQFEDNNL